MTNSIEIAYADTIGAVLDQIEKYEAAVRTFVDSAADPSGAAIRALPVAEVLTGIRETIARHLSDALVAAVADLDLNTTAV